MPAFANRSVGSSCGTSEELAASLWPCPLKKSRNARRTSWESLGVVEAIGARRLIGSRVVLNRLLFRTGGILGFGARPGPCSAHALREQLAYGGAVRRARDGLLPRDLPGARQRHERRV